MLVGYMRISKSDGSQTLALQRDALTEAGAESMKMPHRAARMTGRG